jgi:hypothetical protein
MRAQVSTEFIIFLGIGFLIATVVLVSVYEEEQSMFNRRDQEEIHDLSVKIQQEIAIAGMVEDGYVRNFTLPDALPSGKTYSIFANGTYITIVDPISQFEFSVPEYHGMISIGSNVICRRNSEVWVGSGC